MRNQNIPPIGPGEISLFDLFMEEFDYDAMDPDRKRDLTFVLTLLLACAEGDRINADKLAMLVQRLGGGDSEV